MQPSQHRSSTPQQAPSRFKSTSGLVRVWRAMQYSSAGLIAAVRHEAAFRQELAIGLPLMMLAWWLAATRWQALALCASIVFVWIIEIVNSAIEALADTVTLEEHPLIKRAKDLGSAAVMMSIASAVAVWVTVLWP
jgi:diacylglycerol kinase (ATP)